MEILAILSSASPGKSENHVQEFGKLPGTPKIPDVGKTGSSKTKKIIISGSLHQDLRTVSEIHSQDILPASIFYTGDILPAFIYHHNGDILPASVSYIGDFLSVSISYIGHIFPAHQKSPMWVKRGVQKQRKSSFLGASTRI